MFLRRMLPKVSPVFSLCDYIKSLGLIISIENLNTDVLEAIDSLTLEELLFVYQTIILSNAVQGQFFRSYLLKKLAKRRRLLVLFKNSCRRIFLNFRKKFIFRSESFPSRKKFIFSLSLKKLYLRVYIVRFLNIFFRKKFCNFFSYFYNSKKFRIFYRLSTILASTSHQLTNNFSTYVLGAMTPSARLSFRLRNLFFLFFLEQVVATSSCGVRSRSRTKRRNYLYIISAIRRMFSVAYNYLNAPVHILITGISKKLIWVLRSFL
jgi:hypothetical protein